MRLVILDVQGRRVATLEDGAHAPGRHSVTWNGTGDDGVRLPSGMYFARLESGGRVTAKRILLTR